MTWGLTRLRTRVLRLSGGAALSANAVMRCTCVRTALSASRTRCFGLDRKFTSGSTLKKLGMVVRQDVKMPSYVGGSNDSSLSPTPSGHASDADHLDPLVEGHCSRGSVHSRFIWTSKRLTSSYTCLEMIRTIAPTAIFVDGQFTCPS
jgi:hypothetical protein